jgi:hypothetical protein
MAEVQYHWSTSPEQGCKNPSPTAAVNFLKNITIVKTKASQYVYLE